jgi:hypothetical protein
MDIEVFWAAFKDDTWPAKAGTPYTAPRPRALSSRALTGFLTKCPGLTEMTSGDAAFCGKHFPFSSAARNYACGA